MSLIWAVIASIFCIVWSLLLWEAWKTPITPNNFEEDDFDIEKQQLNSKDFDLLISECQKTTKKVYNRKEIKHWVKFGVQEKYLDVRNRDDIKDWIKLLNNKNINL